MGSSQGAEVTRGKERRAPSRRLWVPVKRIRLDCSPQNHSVKSFTRYFGDSL